MGIGDRRHRPAGRAAVHQCHPGDLGHPRHHLQRGHVHHQRQVLHRQLLQSELLVGQRRRRPVRGQLRGTHLHHRDPDQLADRAGPGRADLGGRGADALGVDPEAAGGSALHLPRAPRRNPQRGVRLLGAHRPRAVPRRARLPGAVAPGRDPALLQRIMGLQRSGAADRLAGAHPDDHPHHRLDDPSAGQASAGPRDRGCAGPGNDEVREGPGGHHPLRAHRHHRLGPARLGAGARRDHRGSPDHRHGQQPAGQHLRHHLHARGDHRGRPRQRPE